MTPEERLKSQLGELLFANCVLMSNNEEAQKQIIQLQADLKAAKEPAPDEPVRRSPQLVKETPNG